jgi:hypothetical protein
LIQDPARGAGGAARGRIDELLYSSQQLAVPMAAACCQLGTADPRGNNAATRVRGQFHCHGTTKAIAQEQQQRATREKRIELWGAEKHQASSVRASKRWALSSSGQPTSHRASYHDRPFRNVTCI